MFFRILKEFFRLQIMCVYRNINRFLNALVNLMFEDVIVIGGIVISIIVGASLLVASLVFTTYQIGKLMITKLNIVFPFLTEESQTDLDLYISHGVIVLIASFLFFVLVLIGFYITLALIGVIKRTWKKAKNKVESGDPDVMLVKDLIGEYEEEWLS